MAPTHDLDPEAHFSKSSARKLAKSYFFWSLFTHDNRRQTWKSCFSIWAPCRKMYDCDLHVSSKANRPPAVHNYCSCTIIQLGAFQRAAPTGTTGCCWGVLPGPKNTLVILWKHSCTHGLSKGGDAKENRKRRERVKDGRPEKEREGGNVKEERKRKEGEGGMMRFDREDEMRECSK